MKNRKKQLQELKQQKQQNENPKYLRIWTFKDGRPYLESETIFPVDKTVHILQSIDDGSDDLHSPAIFPDYDSFDLEAIANEPETRKRMKELENS